MLLAQVTLQLKTCNPLNRREHHYQRAARVRHERVVTIASLRNRVGLVPPSLPLIITLVRISSGTMDSDGAIASLKGVRDAVAKWIGVDDRDSKYLVWRYGQEKGKSMGVRVEFRRGE